ncbi:MAG: hypothetical protein IPL23_29920 [Saprospiraceae bacterium]|nr:hypothetical protein [Saprospiraceae bacterium]
MFLSIINRFNIPKNTIFDAEVDAPYFLSLNGSSSAANALDSLETDVINSKPANGQEFRFTPKGCTATSIKLLNYNSNTATLAWAGNSGSANFEMALSNIDVIPMVGSVVNDQPYLRQPCIQY